MVRKYIIRQLFIVINVQNMRYGANICVNNNMKIIPSIDTIKHLVTDKPKGYASVIRHNPELQQFVNEVTPKLSSDEYSLATKIYWIMNDLQDFPICPTCGNKFGLHKNIKAQAGYGMHCSVKCMNTSVNHINAVRLAISNPDTQSTALRRRQATCKTKYGVSNVLQAAVVKDKIKQTCLERYGFENAAQSICIKDKMKQTCKTKYGVNHYSQTIEWKQKYLDTSLERYGQSHPSKSKYVKLQHMAAAYNRLINNEHTKLLSTFEDYQHTDNLNWICQTCNTTFSSIIVADRFQFDHLNSIPARCPTCFPNAGPMQSNAEACVRDFIQSLNIECECSNRKILSGLELDIYIPSKNIAIEFDGLYWHSECWKPDKNYHLTKTDLCEAKDIHLIHIFENEWLDKQDIVKSRIKNLLGLYDTHIGARKCEVKYVDSKTSFAFQVDNHLQGAVRSKVNVGLYFKDELVSLMTFSKPRFSTKYEWELVRFCNKLGYNIPGAASRLLKYFEKEYKPTNIVSYADRRWSYSKRTVYDTLGMVLSHVSAPNYWYWKGSEFSSRIKYQKHKLSSVLKIYDGNKTETENMLVNGFNRIFDCGNLVYTKTY